MKSLLMALLSTAVVHGGPDEIDRGIQGLGAETHKERVQAGDAILKQAGGDPEAAARLLLHQSRTNQDPEIRARCGELLRTIFEIHELGKGTDRFGFEAGWFLEYDGKSYTVQPMVLKLVTGGPAEKAGMRAGDVITTVNGVSCSGPDSRRALSALLFAIPADAPTVIAIQKGSSNNPVEPHPRPKMREIKISPQPRTAAGDTPNFPEERFQAWLKNLPAS